MILDASDINPRETLEEKAYPILVDALKRIRFQTTNEDGTIMTLKELLDCDPEHVAEGLRECGVLAIRALNQLHELVEG